MVHLVSGENTTPPPSRQPMRATMVHLVSWISAGFLSFKSTSSEEAATALAQLGLTDYCASKAAVTSTDGFTIAS
jgi:DNA-directed RNA polymerase subunit N (RpoN/RPB10)